MIRQGVFYGLFLGLLVLAAATNAQDDANTEREEDAIQSYLGLIFQKLENQKHYPRVAERRGLSGRVVLRFTVRWDGEVLNPEAVVTGDDSFGDAAKQALKRIGRLPPFPDEIKRRELMVEVPISYQVEDRSSSRTVETKDELIGQLLRRAEQGDVKAQAKLCGKYTVTGDAEPPDTASAVKWCRNAAEQGYADGQFGLGVMTFLGQGVTQDNTEAVDWYLRAAQQGHARAQATLAMMHASGGAGLPLDHAEALKWAHRAAEQSDRMGQFGLGIMYANGWGVTQDNTVADKWFLKALEDHDEEERALAQYNMGDMYAEGRSIPRNNAEAAKWYRRAAEQGLAKAQFKLGAIYAGGKGVPQNDGEAAKWYLAAAEQGHDGAQNALRAGSRENSLKLSFSERRLIQKSLAAEGFDPGPADGSFGPRTRKAIRHWQTSRHETATGYLDAKSAKVLLASDRKDETRGVSDTKERQLERKALAKQVAELRENWRCFALSDYDKRTPLFSLIRFRTGAQDFGEVSVAGVSYLASFEIAGLNRRWDFGGNESSDGYPYAFVIKPDGTGLYFDFSTSSDGTAKASDLFRCLMSP